MSWRFYFHKVTYHSFNIVRPEAQYMEASLKVSVQIALKESAMACIERSLSTSSNYFSLSP
jgi:hypothetical protein